MVRLKLDVLVRPSKSHRPCRKESYQDHPYRYSDAPVILLELGWLLAWLDPGETSRGSADIDSELSGKAARVTKGKFCLKHSRVAVSWRTAQSSLRTSECERDGISAAAREIQYSTFSVVVRAPTNFKTRFRDHEQRETPVLSSFIQPVSFIPILQEPAIAELAIKNKLPAICVGG